MAGVSFARSYEKTDSEQAFENTEPVIMVKHYEMSDGIWKTNAYTYQYRLEITGRMANAEKDSTFIFLSNVENITFDQAWKAAGLSSNMDDNLIIFYLWRLIICTKSTINI